MSKGELITVKKKKNIIIFVNDCAGQVCFFNGISTFLGYLMPNPSFYKNSSGTIQPIAGRIRGFIPFPSVIVRKWT